MGCVLIIGATSSIAANVAREYAAGGQKLYLIGRNEEKMRVLREELADAVLGWACFDFEDTERNAREVQQSFQAAGSFDVVLLAPGYLGDQLESEQSFAEAERTIQINYLSVVSFLIPLSNLLERQGRGTLAALSSVAGERGRPRNYTYGSAKSALTTYLQGVRSRLYGQVHVCTIKLGPVDTPMTKTHEKNASFVSSEVAARKIVRAIARHKTEPYVPGFWWAVMAVVRALPQPLFQRLKFLSER